MENIDNELKRLDLEIKKKELLLKEKDYRKNKFITPVTVPIYIGILSFIVSIFLNYLGNNQQIKMERQRFEYSLYLNALNNKTKEAAIEELKFYKDLNLISDFNSKIKERVERKEIPITYPSNSLRKNEISENIFSIEGITKTHTLDIIGVINPLLIDEGGECIGTCNFKFYFQDDNILPLIIDGSGHLISIDSCLDINNDGLNELLIVQSGIQGCWFGAKIFSYKNNKWEMLYHGSVYGCNEDTDFSKRIIQKGNEYIFIKDSFEDSGITQIEEIIK